MKKLNKIANQLITYSLNLKKDDLLFLEGRGDEQFPLYQSALREASKMGINVLAFFQGTDEFKDFWQNATKEEVDAKIKNEASLMKKATAYLCVRGDIDCNLDDKQRTMFNDWFLEVHRKIRLKKPWCLTQLPDQSLVEASGLSLEHLNKIYTNSCSINYEKLSKNLDPLVNYIEKGKSVAIKTPTTHLNFSIENMPAVKCVGKRNMPDGEVYTAPVKDSVNGYIKYNVPSMENGVVHENIYFEFEKGKIVKSNSNYPEELEKILNTDEGARYIGEFSFGLNPLVNQPVGNTLYDEKINGSIHFTPGNAYATCDNGNRSAVHWDLIQIQTPEYGGGEIWIDDQLIRKDGKFVPEDLQILNSSDSSNNSLEK